MSQPMPVSASASDAFSTPMAVAPRVVLVAAPVQCRRQANLA
jgi:hypothetical protein